MVRAGGVMGANAVADCVQIPPGDNAIDQAITSTILDVRLVEAQPEEVVRLVGKAR